MRFSGNSLRGSHAPPELPASMQAVLQLLLRAHDYALDLGAASWDFAVEVETLREIGLANCDVRWLVGKRLADAAVETRSSGNGRRAFRPGAGLKISPRSCLVLTPTGVAFARRLLTPLRLRRAEPVTPLVPRWDSELRQLRLGQHLVKQLRQPAPAQETILAAFETAGWPTSILDPLPATPGVDSRARLHDAVTNLNRHRRSNLVRFTGSGTGCHVCWRLM